MHQKNQNGKERIIQATNIVHAELLSKEQQLLVLSDNKLLSISLKENQNSFNNFGQTLTEREFKQQFFIVSPHSKLILIDKKITIIDLTKPLNDPRTQDYPFLHSDSNCDQSCKSFSNGSVLKKEPKEWEAEAPQQDLPQEDWIKKVTPAEKDTNAQEQESETGTYGTL